MSMIAGKLLGLVRTLARVPAMFSIQETRSWDVPNLTLPGYVCYGSKSGLATLLVSKQFCTIKRSWKHEERCTAILFGTTLVMAVYASDSSEDMCEACVSSVFRVLREGRRGGANKFYITGDLNVELMMLCTDENDVEELNEKYGPLCWQGYDHNPGGYRKIMWYSIMKEFNCKGSSTWSNDVHSKDAACTHKKHGDRGQVKVSQLEFIIGPKREARRLLDLQ